MIFIHKMVQTAAYSSLLALLVALGCSLAMFNDLNAWQHGVKVEMTEFQVFYLFLKKVLKSPLGGEARTLVSQ